MIQSKKICLEGVGLGVGIIYGALVSTNNSNILSRCVEISCYLAMGGLFGTMITPEIYTQNPRLFGYSSIIIIGFLIIPLTRKKYNYYEIF